MSIRLYVFDGPGHGRQVDFHGGSLELQGRDGRCQRYELLVVRRGDAEVQLLAPPFTRNDAGIDEFIDEYGVAPVAQVCPS
jgi:hypothetical protein